MRLNRFFFNFDPSLKLIKINDKEICHQIKNVLKLKRGEEIVLFNNQKEAFCRLLEIKKDFLELEVLKIKENENEPKREIKLYCALLKKENFEIVVQKATEIGIKEIIPIITKRTVKLNLNRIRLEKIIKEAAEQSQRGILPMLAEPIEFQNILNFSKENELNFLFDLKGETLTNKHFEILKDKQKIGLFIGPEGGWDEKEIELAKKNNFIIIKLSSLTFRAETAAIIVSYLFTNL